MIRSRFDVYNFGDSMYNVNQRLEGNFMVYDFSVLFKDELVADVHINTEKNESSLSAIFLDRNSHSCVTGRIFLYFWFSGVQMF